MQVSRFKRPSFDPFPFLQDCFIAPEVDVGRYDVVQAFVVSLMVVVAHKGGDVPFEIIR